MKNRILKILGVAAVATIGMVSCTTDACKDVECGVYGTCVEGDCICELGYSGSDCATVVRDAFIGSGNVNETCTTSTDTYAVTITAGTGITDIVISNLYDAGLTVNGTINADGSVTIPSQTFGTGTISGSATISGTAPNDTLNISFELIIGGDTDSCTVVSV
jgi:hypothetical protein